MMTSIRTSFVMRAGAVQVTRMSLKYIAILRLELGLVPLAGGQVRFLNGLLRLGTTGILLLVPLSFSRATTIVVARSANEIVIGADSKVVDTYGKQLNSQV